MISRARAEPAWLSTNSARSFTLGEFDGEFSICSMMGIARSGSLFIRPRKASSFSSSSFCDSGAIV
jgi:hypothetical protein